MVKIVLIGGKAGSGKTFAGKIMEKWGYKVYNFADELKHFVAKKYGIHEKHLYTQDGKMKIHHPSGKTYRQLLIENAKEIKYFDRDYFTRYVCNRLSMLPQNALVVICDFRYPYEFSFINKIYPGVITIKLIRNLALSIDDASENQLNYFNFDITIQNNGNDSDGLELALKANLFPKKI